MTCGISFNMNFYFHNQTTCFTVQGRWKKPRGWFPLFSWPWFARTPPGYQSWFAFASLLTALFFLSPWGFPCLLSLSVSLWPNTLYTHTFQDKGPCVPRSPEIWPLEILGKIIHFFTDLFKKDLLTDYLLPVHSVTCRITCLPCMEIEPRLPPTCLPTPLRTARLFLHIQRPLAWHVCPLPSLLLSS